MTPIPAEQQGQLRVVDVMSRNVEFIDGDATVCDAAVMMGELDVGALPVGSAEHVEGIVTDRDILYRVVARCLDSATVKVREILSQPVISCEEGDSIPNVLDLMAEHQVRRLPVRGGDGLVSGWVTLADLSRKLLADNSAIDDSLRKLTGDSLMPLSP